jgi:hypothetical protein
MGKNGLCECEKGFFREFGGQEGSMVGCRPSKGPDDRVTMGPHETGAPGESRPDATSCLESQWRTDYEYQREYGHLWWHAQLLLFMFTGAAKFHVLKDYSREMLGQTPSCIAVHIRRGDSCKDGGSPYKKCVPNEVYVAHISRLVARYGTRAHVYLATDDEGAVSSLRAAHPEYKWISQDMRRDKYGAEVQIDDNAAARTSSSAEELFKVRVGTHAHCTHTDYNQLSLFKDVWAMSSCDIFVGSMTSSIGWVSYGLMVARHGLYTPFVAVDGYPYATHSYAGQPTIYAENNLRARGVLKAESFLEELCSFHGGGSRHCHDLEVVRSAHHEH